jgi:hypothetical protein
MTAERRVHQVVADNPEHDARDGVQAMFFRHCMDTFLERTRPASSMAKPAAIHMTRKPPIRNSSVLKMKAVFRHLDDATASGALRACARPAGRKRSQKRQPDLARKRS